MNHQKTLKEAYYAILLIDTDGREVSVIGTMNTGTSTSYVHIEEFDIRLTVKRTSSYIKPAVKIDIKEMVHAALIQTIALCLVTSDNHIYRSTSEAFTEISGTIFAYDAGYNDLGKLWVIGSGHNIYFDDNGVWTPLPNGCGMRIAGGLGNMPWIIGMDNRVYRLIGSDWKTVSNGFGKDIAVDGMGRPWVIGMDNSIGYYDNSQWKQYSDGGRGKRIAVAKSGIPFIIDMNDKIYQGTGAGWYELPGMTGKDIAVSDEGVVWIVGTDGQVWYFDEKWIKFTDEMSGEAIAAL